MTSVQRTLNTLAILLSTVLISHNAQATVYDDLRAQMEDGCPNIWEDLGVAISATIPAGDVWAGDIVDRTVFVNQYATAHSVTTADAELVADVIDAVSIECASFRLAMVDELMSKTTTDVSNAMTAAGGIGAGDFLSGAWQTGDVRVTGRNIAATGWVFLTGQTVGQTGAAADLSGSEYLNLYELAKTWAPNTGTEVWANNDVVNLPDMRGRSLYGADNMGSVSADVITSAEADLIGGEIGQEQEVLAVNQMPSHTHTMGAAGTHDHPMTMGGSHQHKLRTSVYTGSGAGQTTYPYFEGKARVNYQNTIKKNAVLAEGNHDHDISNAGSHAHTNDHTGGSDPINTVSPGLVFNVEMKY